MTLKLTKSTRSNVDRLEYAREHRSRYLLWGEQVARSPYSSADKMEFALLSAHTLQEAAIRGFMATRGHYAEDELRYALYRSGVLAAKVKAGRLVRFRREVRHERLALPECSTLFPSFRKDVKVEGLGYCKMSFGLALSAPLSSPVVCFDTHLCRAFGVKDWSLYRSLANYERVESLLTQEAQEANLPPFLYQWAVWDYMRWYEPPAGVRFAPDDHSFLWRGGRTKYQTRMEV